MHIRNKMLVFCLLAASTGSAQGKEYFEGRIFYRFEVASKIPQKVDTAKLAKIMGSGSILFFKKGNYYHKYDGGIFEFDLYRKSDNKAYLKKRNNDTIYWHDCGAAGKKVERFSFTEKKATILGISCDELVIQYGDKTETHFFNADSISINPEWFKRFTLNDENLIDEKEKSIYLSNKIESLYFTFVETATQLKRERIDDKIFEIPSNAILAKDREYYR